MRFSFWLRNWKRSAPRAGAHRFPRQRSTFRHQLEVLEDRLTTATVTVNSVADNRTDTNALNLRAAITLVNHAGDPTSLGQSSMPAGWQSQISGGFGSNDTIQFDRSLSGQTISLFSGQLIINKSLTIQGLAAPWSPSRS